MTTIYTTLSKLDLLPPHPNHHPHPFPLLSFPLPPILLSLRHLQQALPSTRPTSLLGNALGTSWPSLRDYPLLLLSSST